MSDFNPREPITDPSVFAPRGMFVDNRRGKRLPGEKEDDDKAFVFDASDMKALNRFLGTGRTLQTTRAKYLESLGIEDDPKEISMEVGVLIDRLVETYSSIKESCVQFKDVTWNGIVDIAGEIKTYATMSGGKQDTSYCVLMLKFLGDYHEERKKPNPDKDKMAELEESIQTLLNAELKKLGELQARSAEVITGLQDFQTVCESHGEDMQGKHESLENQLKNEGSNVEELQREIKELEDEIMELQRQVEERNRAIDRVPWYIWLGTIGFVIGVKTIAESLVQIKQMINSMEKFRQLIKEKKGKLRIASHLLGNSTSISDQVTRLSNQISPAVHTLEKLQGAWKIMETDLKAIKDVVEFDSDNIPSMLIAPNQLQGIVDEWNELKEYASRYIENAYLSEDPETMTMDRYIEELKNAVETIEAMQGEQVQG